MDTKKGQLYIGRESETDTPVLLKASSLTTTEGDQSPAEKCASMTLAKRLKRVFNIDIETCSECGGDVRLIASIA